MASGRRLELRISVSSGAGDEDLIVDAASSDRVGDLSAAAAALLGETSGRGLWCERRAQALDGKALLGECGIRWGDRLLLVPPLQEPTRAGGAALVELIVTGGPCAGRCWALGSGSYRLGRDPGSGICLPDPSLSRDHAVVRVEAAGTAVTDLGSSNGTAIDGRSLPRDTPQVVQGHDELELGRTLIRFRWLARTVGTDVLDHDGRVEFNRPPRVHVIVEPFGRELAAPPSRGRKARLPLAASLLPVAAGVVLFLLLKSPVMLAIAGLSPLMAIGSYVSDRRGGSKSFARASAEFRARLTETLEELGKALQDEIAQRRRESADAPTLIERARSLDPSLWERRARDEDFLRLRVGVGDLPARSTVTVRDGGDEDLRAVAARELDSRKTVPAVPVTVDLRRLGVLGLAGRRPLTCGLARWLTLQAAALHSPGDLVIAAAVSESAAAEWTWLKWLPHVRGDRVGLQTALAIGQSESEQLMSGVRDLVAARRADARLPTAGEPPRAHLLLLLDEDASIDRALVSAALAEAAQCGVSAIWLGRDVRNLPGQAAAIVDVPDSRAMITVTEVATGTVVSDVSADAVERDLAEQTARVLAPVRDVSELARAGDIPRSVSLLDLIGLSPPRPEALARRWSSWSGGLGAPVGVTADGPFLLDLRSEGPHALIAGTTGSGKSELLRTYVAASAAAVPPDRLSFLLVDYKGGSAFAPCAALPHVVDVVSDLDEHLAERALVSLHAELKRRERILAEHGAKDLLELQRRNPHEAPPVLVIAVDEFAKLREEVPEFVDGVVDIAQRGRSLGVHMVLAAQTLRNAFTPAIRANTNLRVALRVAEETESQDMIGSSLAARIPSGDRFRGRGYARTGHSELREFQAAYVSGHTALGSHRELTLSRFDLAAFTGVASEGASDSDADNDLTALAAAARQAQEDMGLRLPVAPWLSPLPRLLSLDDVDTSAVHGAGTPIGLVDLPHLQRQDPLVIDLADVGHVAVFGAGGSGKTTLLSTTALTLAQTHTPEELRLYGLDAASGQLASLEVLPHCGGVVRADDEERVERLFRELLRRIDRHTQVDPAVRPQTTVLFIDDLGSFAQQYDRPGFGSPYEHLQRVMAGGRAARVHVVLTASRRGALPAALAAHVGQRLVLRMPTEEDLLSLGLDAKRVRGARLPVGRGFTQDSLEFQVAVPVRDGQRLGPEDAVRVNTTGFAVVAPRLEILPAQVPRASLGPVSGLDGVAIGLADDDFSTARVDLADTHFLIVGPYKSGRSTALETLVLGAREADRSARFHLLAPRRSRLRDMDAFESIATNLDACVATAMSLVDRLGTGELEANPEFLFIDDGGELNEAMIVTLLEKLVRGGRDSSLRIVAAVETSAARGIGMGWIRELRKDGNGLLLQPDLTGDGDLMSVRLPRRLPAALVPGRGFVARRGSAELIQVAS